MQNRLMNAPVSLTLLSGNAVGCFRLTSIETALITVIAIVAVGIPNLIEHPTKQPSACIAELAAHVLCALGLVWDDAHDVAGQNSFLCFNIDPHDGAVKKSRGPQ